MEVKAKSYFLQKDEVLKRVEVMTRGEGTLSVGHVSVVGDLLTQRATIRLKVFSSVGDKTRPLAGTNVVAQLRRELAADPQLLSQVITKLFFCMEIFFE